ncbi:hypothetical protein HETIRDRAFT_419140 [Heterobasidion irregulare TC 32-1]|uniref:Nucleoprotein TPR/MLP1-2 domain-containing protein n=1 Tax=Heterobasidion irregulare (strain TC 32-1) TaxID=747525 RepID=W4K219_HETIT|nr:uncharacterized protein HETIRDRAFT_419140 [Heterobasidion irregulare TC 32-1]ETW79390.1 hypothetical protein HETIRDRAFT_419140 [Heterobasidion irregulare TC 32-1]
MREECAESAKAKYKTKVIAHGESLRDLEGLKLQLSKLQIEAWTHLTAAETTQAKLASSESSWGQQREALDKEIANLTARQVIPVGPARDRDAGSAPPAETEPAGDVDEMFAPGDLVLVEVEEFHRHAACDEQARGHSLEASGNPL